ncbi:MAG: glycosyltransferase [Lentisphaeria bacterium]|nr:glycosyltransferase [Lentisphaeria bacterium]
MKFAAIQLITVALIVNCIVGLFCVDLPEQRVFFWQNTGFPRVMFTVGMAFAIFTTLYMLLQAVLAAFYRAKKPVTDDALLPECTVIVPAYNESEGVYSALKSIVEVDYPAEKLEIIAINDGSKDDTWEWICRAAADSEGRIRPINLEVNGGKKAALCRAVRESRNPIIITVDSDSQLEKHSFRALVAPFADFSIGAVAGTIRVQNMNKGILPRMLDVCFVFGCDFMRCAQSVLGYVLCTPGAISAYRKDTIMPLLDTWLAQTFLGAPSTIGEDRALTSLILQSGKKVVSQSNAVALTQVPERYSGLCKMLLRWTRGDIRESLMLLKFVTRRWSLTDWKWSLFQLNIASQIIGMTLPFIFIPCTVYTFVQFSDHLLFMIYYIFSINSVWSLLPAAIYARKNSKTGAIWAFVYGVFSLVALSWICIYSLLTLRNSSWLTREKKSNA